MSFQKLTFLSLAVFFVCLSAEDSEQNSEVTTGPTYEEKKADNSTKVSCFPAGSVDWNVVNYKIRWGIDYSRDKRKHILISTKPDLKKVLETIATTLQAIDEKKDCLSQKLSKDLVDTINHLRSSIESNLNINLLFSAKVLSNNLDEIIETLLTIYTKIGGRL